MAQPKDRSEIHKTTSLQVLRELLAVHEKQTMSAAAERLSVSLATLSRHLGDFHSDSPVGQTLLIQENKTWRLTPRGEAALPAIRDLVRQYEQLLTFLMGDDDDPQLLRVGLGNFAAQHYFPRVLMAARQKTMQKEARGGWRIETEVLRNRDRILSVFDGVLDCAVVSHTADQVQLLLAETRHETSRHDQPALTVEPLAQHPFCVIAAHDSQAGEHLSACPPQPPIPLKQLANVELVGLDSQSGIRRRLEQQLRTIHREPLFLPGSGAGGWYAAKEFARNGIGAAIVPLAVMEKTDAPEFVLRHLPDELRFDESLVYRRLTIERPALTEFMFLLRDAAREFCHRTNRVWGDIQ